MPTLNAGDPLATARRGRMRPRSLAGLVVACCLALAACGGGGSGSSKPELLGVAWGNDVFVAVGADGQSYVSSSGGQNWASYDVGLAEGLNAIAFGSGRFVAVGNAGAIATSPLAPSSAAASPTQ